jgi:drug/metabolite transporter (DMT)-like permease
MLAALRFAIGGVCVVGWGNLTTPLFGVLATALVIGEPVRWRLAVWALLVAGGIAVTTVLRDRALAARSAVPRSVPRRTP